MFVAKSGPLEHPRIGQRKNTLLGTQPPLFTGNGVVSGANPGTQDAPKGCVFTRPVPVRFLHRIKERGRKRPRSESQRPAMRGAERACGLEIRCGLGGRSAPLFDFRWSLRCGMTAVACHFAASSGAVRDHSPRRRLQMRSFRPVAPPGCNSAQDLRCYIQRRNPHLNLKALCHGELCCSSAVRLKLHPLQPMGL